MTINPEYTSPTGALTVLDIVSLSGFAPKRLFWIKDVPVGVTRGKHAHKKTNQYLMCLTGVVQLNTFDGKNWRTVVLDEGMSDILPAMVWGEQVFLAPDTVLLVACDTPYDRSDYIESMQAFYEARMGLNGPGEGGADISPGTPPELPTLSGATLEGV